MPTFEDPVHDAREASEALRGLAHATRSFEDPADAYDVIGDLLAGMRSVRQVLDQLADTHLLHRGRATDDSGDRDAGAADVLAAADFLHEAGGLMEQTVWVLDQAAQHASRITWQPGNQPVQRWVSVIFLQGKEADLVLDVIHRDGELEAIKHLSLRDRGDETTGAAMENGHVYDEPPIHGTDRHKIDGSYALTYNQTSGSVALYRRHTVEPDDAVETPRPVRRDPPHTSDSPMLLRVPTVGAEDWPWLIPADRPGGNEPRGISQ